MADRTLFYEEKGTSTAPVDFQSSVDFESPVNFESSVDFESSVGFQSSVEFQSPVLWQPNSPLCTLGLPKSLTNLDRGLKNLF